ncbi:hypothetical protein Hbl1158_17115 (plasmid) [Halobaculum sp. CBA1158]|uniref:hypothetical protein n=1 Tax=Halobaculum sp. CBA1158 TaxID=2904243 RepID=UPI001F173D8E|nr:hypothetical protein [Halobaculum sp. CBA1158]UIP01723.1 hypothetical protein Hbl1158_17115 [Halobaculum sp. CBA1158]
MSRDEDELVVQHVRDRIEEIEDDPRMDYDDANVRINAPLALHQCEQKGRLAELRGVLEVLEDGA